mmetsp:Transcript_36047/g.66457  ORF Transcript_36047/g.66457 Transcript_36047/m.66457 type:complete len:222 (-) Transcript_36047:132-797(-)
MQQRQAHRPRGRHRNRRTPLRSSSAVLGTIFASPLSFLSVVFLLLLLGVLPPSPSVLLLVEAKSCSRTYRMESICDPDKCTLCAKTTDVSAAGATSSCERVGSSRCCRVAMSLEACEQSTADGAAACGWDASKGRCRRNRETETATTTAGPSVGGTTGQSVGGTTGTTAAPLKPSDCKKIREQAECDSHVGVCYFKTTRTRKDGTVVPLRERKQKCKRVRV